MKSLTRRDTYVLLPSALLTSKHPFRGCMRHDDLRVARSPESVWSAGQVKTYRCLTFSGFMETSASGAPSLMALSNLFARVLNADHDLLQQSLD